MLTIHKRIVVDNRGRPCDVIVPWSEFLEIEEILGLDLDANAKRDLRAARKDRMAGKGNANVDRGLWFPSPGRTRRYWRRG